MDGAPEAVALSAFDAGLVDLAVDERGVIRASWPDGSPASFDEIEPTDGGPDGRFPTRIERASKRSKSGL